jgi:poly(A) polymerase
LTKRLHSHAVDVVKRLVQEGHTAYFAGGWVRDFLMGHPSDDIDIATSATPEQILDLFPRTILVGLQFGVVIVSMDGHQYEVATFRKDIEYQNGRKPEKIELSSPLEDAKRRDFTINGMFYDPLEDVIYDYVGGQEDLKKGVVRAIGNADERFFEDRLRMIRAIRFASRFQFHIDPDTEEAIRVNAQLLFPAVAMERIWQEFCKMHAYPHFDKALIELHKHGLLQIIFPTLPFKKQKELEEHLAPLKNYPDEAPACFFLQELFGECIDDEVVSIAKRLKLCNKDIELLLFYRSHLPFEERIPYKKAYFYSHRDSELCLKVYAARLSSLDREAFLYKHQKQREELASHINRIQHKTPVLSSKFLMSKGVKPGKEMGFLLEKAEQLSIDENIDDPELLYQRIKNLNS